ncbi:MAG: hypothetical protein ACRDWE_12325, partial [Acidimicrobiales bacterium]
MAALLSETATPLTPLEQEPAAPAAHRSRTWLRSLDVYVPGVFLLAVLFLCFIWPYLYHMPSPTNGSILTSNLPVGAAGHILGTTTLG